MSDVKTVEWVNGRVRMIDQTKLPYKFTYVNLQNYHQVAAAIKGMIVRGAPAIGAAAAMGLALTANANRRRTGTRLLQELEVAARVLRFSRPTAWNLFWAVDRVMHRANVANGEGADVASAVVEEARKIAEEDVASCHRIGEAGAALLADGDRVLTHCNAGTLATVSYGTALAPIRTAISQGKKVKVIATETRPRLQGAKLTTYELGRDGIPVTLIVDGAAGYVMKRGMVQKAIVGADRITDKYVANKVGTYLIALAAKANNIPFYVAAPSSTFDLRKESSEVKIEERDAEEVTHIWGKRIPPRGVPVFNPAFDLTPVELVQGFITERGVIAPGDVKEAMA
ncbi:MAG TPA: S-methyl-5-thioribose-1-phosphate isomerase [Candidatus Acidoferrales bacterium]|nr:S-methyl-5-thioribose-1-phosphate isomerase [Candidatus Acidoferrales bacterium]